MMIFFYFFLELLMIIRVGFFDVAFAQGCCEKPPPPGWDKHTRLDLVVPSLAGEAVDSMARAVAKELESSWRSPVIVKNVPGTGGLVGAGVVAQSKEGGKLCCLLASTP